MFVNKNIRNIGIFAHVDAGKTTLTENILYECGSIKNKGRVDEGTAHTDSMDVEKRRGISVRAAAASVKWGDVQINIIDTPGHVDFSAEVERSLMALDGAVLVISAMEGVQSQTEVIWNALRDMEIPTIIFVNKIDRAGADTDRVLKQIRSTLTKAIVPVQLVYGAGEKNPDIISINSADGKQWDTLCDGICEVLGDYSDLVLDRVVNEEKISRIEVEEILSSLSQKGSVFPVFFGSALRGVGVLPVIDGIIKYLPRPLIYGDEEAAGLAYKIYHGKYGGKSVHMRLYEGNIWVRGTIYNSTRDVEEKITGIFKLNGSDYEPADYLKAGEIGIVSGLYSTKTGDIFGKPKGLKIQSKIASPTLTVQVRPVREEQLDAMVEAFLRLEEEDPLLNVQWMADERELHVQLMGMIQMEILTEIVKNRFDIEVTFEKPTVIYKETPAKTGTGYISMTKPYFAALEIKVEPLPRGTGFIYESDYTTDFIFPRFQNEVRDTVPQSIKEAIYGWELTDIKVSLTGGRSIELATKPSDFRAVTPIAVMRAINDAGTVLLEPIQEFEIKVSIDEAGVVIGDLVGMRGVMNEQIVEGESFIIRGVVPVAPSIDYSTRINSLSQGRGIFKTKFLGYQDCPIELGRIRQRKTVDPSDVERYLSSISKKSMRDHAANKNRG